MKNAEHQAFYKEMVESYRTMFSSMDDIERISWFVSMDESAILGFEVRGDESVSQAQERHKVKLLAIAAALSSLPSAARDYYIIEDLRKLAGETGQGRITAS